MITPSAPEPQMAIWEAQHLIQTVLFAHPGQFMAFAWDFMPQPSILTIGMN